MTGMKPTIEFDGQRIDGEAFHRRILKSASALRSAGLGDGDVVALMMRNGPEVLEVMLAARWLGALWCPINWHFKTDEVQYILSDSGARVLVADAALLARLPGLATTGLTTFVARRTRTPAWPTHATTLRQPLSDAARAPRGAMFYTSGTTGRPKGILRARGHARAGRTRPGRCCAMCSASSPACARCVSAPMYHSAPNSYCIGASLESAHAVHRAALRRRTHAAADRAAPPHPCLPGADDVRAPAARCPRRCGGATT